MKSRAFIASGDEWTLERWLEVCHGRKAADERDFVFAGLSLLKKYARQQVPELTTEVQVLTPGIMDALAADYSRPSVAVFIAFTIALLKCPLGINTLSLVGVLKDSRFPSWTINPGRLLNPKPLYQISGT